MAQRRSTVERDTDPNESQHSDDVLTSRLSLSNENEPQSSSTCWRSLIGGFLIQVVVSSLPSIYGVLFMTLESTDLALGKKMFLISLAYVTGSAFADTWFRKEQPAGYSTSRLHSSCALIIIIAAFLINCATNMLIFQILGFGLVSGICSSQIMTNTETLLSHNYPTHGGYVVTFSYVGAAVGNTAMPVLMYTLVIHYGYNVAVLAYIIVLLQGLLGIFCLFSKNVKVHTNTRGAYSLIDGTKTNKTFGRSLHSMLFSKPVVKKSELLTGRALVFAQRPPHCVEIMTKISEEDEVENNNAKNERKLKNLPPNTNQKMTRYWYISPWNLTREHEGSLDSDGVFVTEDDENTEGNENVIFTKQVHHRASVYLINENLDGITSIGENYEKKNENQVSDDDESDDEENEIEPESNEMEEVMSESEVIFDIQDEQATLSDSSISSAVYLLLLYAIINPFVKSVQTPQFYPMLLLKTTTKLSPILFGCLAPPLAVYHIPSCTLESAAFTVSVAGFTWLSVLVLTPWCRSSSLHAHIYLYAAGCTLEAIGFYLLAIVESRDQLTLGSALYGIGYGINTVSGSKLTEGPTTNTQLQIKVEKCAGYIILFLSVFLYIILGTTYGIRQCFLAVAVLQVVTALAWIIRPFIRACENWLCYTTESEMSSNETSFNGHEEILP